MDKHSLIRTIYLYLFAIVGLTLLVIAGVRFINMGLKAFVFTKADEQLRLDFTQFPSAPVAVEKLDRISQNAGGKEVQVTLAENEIQQIDQWLVDYKNYKEERESLDIVSVNRQKDASINLAMIIVGFPLYLYHWGIIRRETKKSENNRTASL